MVTIGYQCNFIDNIKKTLNQYEDYGFDYIAAPLIPMNCKEFIPFSEVFLDSKDRSKVVIIIPKRDYRIEKNIKLFEKELNFIGHVGIRNALIDCPSDYESIENIATIINRKLNHHSETNDHHCLAIAIRLSFSNNQKFSNELRKNSSKMNDKENEMDYEWNKWNHFRKIMQFHSNISIALEMNGELSDDQDRIDRWLGEPLKFIVLPTSIFLTNSSQYPVLSKMMQSFIGRMNFKMANNFSILIKGNNLHEHIKYYNQYLIHLQKTDIFVDELQKFCQFYEDLLQYPLQPLKDDLDSSVYEVFETDLIKYQQYEKAIEKALLDIQKDVIVAMVVGAGRGPLVDKALKAAFKINKYIKIYAVEKNTNAVITLNMLRDLKWGGQKGIRSGNVQIISCDMRNWQAPEKADLIISELLGSFGDNELSPECLDGVCNYVNEDAICIPESYNSYLCPIQSHKLYSQLSLDKRTNINPFEYAYVVHIRNAYLIDKPKKVFSFEHLRGQLHREPSLRNNSRSKRLTFRSKIPTICHGFVGYFDCCLYGDINLSIVPSTQNSDMYSWFPIYFPIQTPFDVIGDDDVDINNVTNHQQRQHIEMQITRNVSNSNVWYEWTVVNPIQTKIHNLNGKHYSISLH